MKRPLIGITGKRRFGRDLAGNWSSMSENPADIFWTNYAEGVLFGGGFPVFLSIDSDPIDAIDHLDGLLLTGGTDIEPKHYGEASDTDLFPYEPIRDEFEFGLLDAVIKSPLPVLGICRGHQVVNVHAGGSLNQHVPEHASFDQTITTKSHEVLLKDGSKLSDLYGPRCEVNSFHHQTVDRVGEGFEATAHAQDGAIEGLEHSELPILSVQWHPEMLPTRPTDPIFSWLVKEAS
ncbi:MAG TPA: gamma-glutamyl-gamma-aminobutyrate hydrolase family protein [Acidimicrobiales bacterium]|nr:gamma-glutamyl-gamma-aminobutyrate hydrolase family protein [Acidimicrobiales bacterium]|tara:strand:- start:4010 stop:4711 length:702 start_codon:yes stop_codon:yes gene_type:complete